MLSTNDATPKKKTRATTFFATPVVPLHEPIRLECPSTSVHWPHVMQQNWAVFHHTLINHHRPVALSFLPRTVLCRHFSNRFCHPRARLLIRPSLFCLSQREICILYASSEPCVVGPVIVGSCYSAKMLGTLNIILRANVWNSVLLFDLRRNRKGVRQRGKPHQI